jgi:TetR/AcrR family transcriptional repressor of uid operon
MARHHFSRKGGEEVLLCTEVMAEARRNPDIARISAAFDADVRKWLGDLLRAAVVRGDVPSGLDLDGVVTMLMIIADGVWWRRALDPGFDPATMVPVFMDITRHMLRARPRGPETVATAPEPVPETMETRHDNEESSS